MRPVLFACALALAACSPEPASRAPDMPEEPPPLRGPVLSGPATDVHDGDSFRVEGVKLRPIGYDAPELGQPGGREARDHLTALLAAGTSCETIGRTSYDRQLAECELPDGRSLQEAMLAEGWGWTDARYSCDDARLEREARAARRGLWALPGRHVHPARWRKPAIVGLPECGAR